MPDLMGSMFVMSPGGETDFGVIGAAAAQAIGVSSGPIRLQYGYAGPKGYGDRHVESYPDRMKSLRSLGYPTFARFAFDVGQNYTKIGEGDSGRLLLIRPLNGYDLRLVVQHDVTGFWNIITGLPYRVARCKVLYQLIREGGSEPTPRAIDQPRRFATLSLPNNPNVDDSGS